MTSDGDEYATEHTLMHGSGGAWRHVHDREPTTAVLMRDE